jgi:hypothetical protein
MFRPHRFIPKILKRLNIKRKEMSGYPNRLKNRVAKTIAPRKRINCIGDPVDSGEGSFFTCPSLPWKKIFKTKAPDKIMRSIPRIKGNIPVPAIRKVPMGIFKERRTVAPPKKKITIPTIISSLFIPSLHKPKPQITNFKCQRNAKCLNAKLFYFGI